MPGHFARFQETRSSPGIIVVSQNLDIGAAIEDLLLIWAATTNDIRVPDLVSSGRATRAATRHCLMAAILLTLAAHPVWSQSAGSRRAQPRGTSTTTAATWGQPPRTPNMAAD
jgi:hypothetical protein